MTKKEYAAVVMARQESWEALQDARSASEAARLHEENMARQYAVDNGALREAELQLRTEGFGQPSFA